MATKNSIVSVYIPPALLERIKRLASADGRSMSSFIVRHLQKKLSTRGATRGKQQQA